MRFRSSPNLTAKLDKTAVVLSGLCLVHCLLLPLLIALFPVLGFDLIPHETFHQLILILVVPTAAVALGIGYRRHRNRAVAALGLAGVAALVAAAFIVHALGGESAERWITVAGGLLLAGAHLRNFQLSRHTHTHPHEAAAAGLANGTRDAR